jgi:UDP-N-acetylglucosamine--N-acetylmuramyl-(pentapeptide) pyrophosphoryl-undecaprenol N-acetylglucosamine transferase
MTRPLTVILAAGGTGGHVFPAMAVADALRVRGMRVILATDQRGRRFEGDVETATVMAGGIAGGLVAKLKGLAKIGIGVAQGLRLLRRSKANVVVGFGGFPSLPTMLAAMLLGRPTIIHDQNAVLGRANRLISGRVRAIATAFPSVVGVDACRASFVGNPVRQAIAEVGETEYSAPAAIDRCRILVFGGSQGARVLSDVLPAALALLPSELRSRLSLAQQCRPEDLDRVAAAYSAAELDVELAAFFDDMPGRLKAAHLVIARSGASTVAELAVSGRPALLIPYAAAMDDHQTANAAALVEAGAAWRLSEADATPEKIADVLQSLFDQPIRLSDAAQAARTVARPNAAEALADLIVETASAGTQKTGAVFTRGIAA